MLRSDEPTTTGLNSEGWFDDSAILGADHDGAMSDDREGKDRRGK